MVNGYSYALNLLALLNDLFFNTEYFLAKIRGAPGYTYRHTNGIHENKYV